MQTKAPRSGPRHRRGENSTSSEAANGIVRSDRHADQQAHDDEPERVVDEELRDREDDDRDQVDGEQQLATEPVGQPSTDERAEEDADQRRGADQTLAVPS